MLKALVFIAIFFPVFVNAQENIKVEDDIPSKKKPEFVFQIDQRNSFIRQKPVNINGIFVGLNYNNKHQFSVGIYTLSPWNRPKPFAKNDSITEVIKFNLYFLSLGYTPTVFSTKKFKLTIPFEIGFGFSEAKATAYWFEKKFEAKRFTNIVPAQIGIFGEYKLTRWIGINFSVGYRKLILEKFYQIKVNYDGFYYNYGLNLYFDNITTDWKAWRQKVKNSEGFLETKNKIKLQAGYSFSRLRDSYISSYEYNARSIPVNLALSRLSGENYHSLNLTFNSALFSTPTNKDFKYTTSSGLPYFASTINGLTQNSVRNILLTVSYGYAHKMVEAGHLKIFLGGKISYSLLNKNFLVLRYENNLREQFLSLNAFFFARYNLSPKNLITYSLASPVLNYISRDHIINHISYDRSIQYTSMSHYFAFNSNLTYSYKITKAWAIDVDYSFFYYQYANRSKERLASQNLILGLSYNF